MIRLSTNSFSWNTTYNKGLDELTPVGLCRKAAGCGAEGIEIDPTRVTAEQLNDCGLCLSGGSTGGPLYDNWTAADADKVVATAADVKAIGGEYVFFTAAPKGGWGAHEPVTGEDLAVAGERFNALASRVVAEGVALGLHNHAACPEGLAAELALVRDHVDPALIGLYLDIGWAFCSEGDPAAIVRGFGERCTGFQLRTHTADKAPTETLSEGALDTPEIVDAIIATGYAGWVALELWHREDVLVTKSMPECQTESLAYLRRLFAGA